MRAKGDRINNNKIVRGNHMKILRLVFSKWLISVLLLLAQVAAIVLVAIYLLEYLIWFQIVSVVIGVIVFFVCVNRKENPEYKIPWLFLILFLPLFGVLFYLMFSRVNTSRKMRKIYAKAYDELLPYVNNIDKDIEKAYEYMGDRQGIDRYLKENSGLGPQQNNEVKYYPVGELMWKDMLEALESAKKFILMEYFIVDPGHMWDSIHEILARKAKEGVRVHLVYDDLGTMTMLKSGYYKKLRKEGIDAHKFNPFTPIVSAVYNNRSHRKIMVVDGLIGFTGGINLGDEYINENDRLGHWKDTGLRIRGTAVNSLTALFFTDFIIAKKEIPEFEFYFNKNPEKFNTPGTICPFGDGPRPLYYEQIGEENFINIVGQAKKYFYISTPYLIIDHHFTQALKNAAMRGVDVRVITPHIPDKKIVFCLTRSSYKELRKAGVKVYEYTPGFIHAKMLVSDDDMAFVGTINMDFRSLTHHFECGAVLYKNDCIKDIYNDFQHIFEVSQEIDNNFKLSFGAKVAKVLLETFRTLF